MATADKAGSEWSVEPTAIVRRSCAELPVKLGACVIAITDRFGSVIRRSVSAG